MPRIFFVIVSSISIVTSALAVDPNEILKNPDLEARARAISKGLRCVVCQNQSIDDSDASLARDLRILVRKRLSAGDTNKQVLDYVVSRYGDFVLLKPPVKLETLVLWFSPFIIIIIGLTAGIIFFRRQRYNLKSASLSPALNNQEREKLNNMLED
ncbi:MAG: cytochrome c-type biogenesis protein CcmH [Magnetovibrio sp.]|nr:cytochrome c-type biogenesis protein CcmH [Magnetovibrio sp.]|tara:strand:- start:706 stop:1173 length:468 start_codon:yes stop_codon:yes gene_type:complete